MQGSGHERELLLPSERDFSYQDIPRVFHAQCLECRVSLFPDTSRGHAIDGSEKIQVLPHGQPFIKREFLAHIANMPLDFLRLAKNIIACHSPCA